MLKLWWRKYRIVQFGLEKQMLFIPYRILMFTHAENETNFSFPFKYIPNTEFCFIKIANLPCLSQNGMVSICDSIRKCIDKKKQQQQSSNSFQFNLVHVFVICCCKLQNNTSTAYPSIEYRVPSYEYQVKDMLSIRKPCALCTLLHMFMPNRNNSKCLFLILMLLFFFYYLDRAISNFLRLPFKCFLVLVSMMIEIFKRSIICRFMHSEMKSMKVTLKYGYISWHLYFYNEMEKRVIRNLKFVTNWKICKKWKRLNSVPHLPLLATTFMILNKLCAQNKNKNKSYWRKTFHQGLKFKPNTNIINHF